MKIWNYHPVTHELLGSSVADPNPVQKDSWIMPAHATPVTPGQPQLGRAYQFNGQDWSSVADHRGEVWWLADATDNTDPRVVTAIGDPAAFETPLTNVEPLAPPAPPVTVSARQLRMALTRLELRVAIENYIASADQDMKDWWQYATEFGRGNPMIANAATALGKTPADIDALFELAKTL
jgi:hypothetical protein